MQKYQPILVVLVVVAFANLLRTIFIEIPVWQHVIGAYLVKHLGVE